jgi:hypothetical protein
MFQDPWHARYQVHWLLLTSTLMFVESTWYRDLYFPCTVDRLHSECSDVDFAKMIQVETTCHLAL